MFKYIFLVVFLVIITGCQKENKGDSLTIAVTILPQEEFVKEIVGDNVEIITIIPPGYSPENYELTPKQLSNIIDADLYFAIGLASENNIISQIEKLNPDLNIIHLDEEVRKVYEDRYFEDDVEYFEEDEHNGHDHDADHNDEEHTHEGRDPHIWLSPRRVKIIVSKMKDELIDINPNRKEIIEENAEKYIKKIDELDVSIKSTINEMEQKAFIIYHPSLGYFADDYNLEMINIEKEGKEASSRHLERVIDIAKEKDIKFVFYQSEFDKAQPETIADVLGGEAIELNPLASNYLENMEEIANTFKEVLAMKE
ncbi:MAG: metal ABC transporter solute-binding protein, Zn/Mn family [Eubacteriales bacterium]